MGIGKVHPYRCTTFAIILSEGQGHHLITFITFVTYAFRTFTPLRQYLPYGNYSLTAITPLWQ